MIKSVFLQKIAQIILLLFFLLLQSACGFHLQGQSILAPPLHVMYLQTTDPYGQLARQLKQHLKNSNVLLVSSPAEADTILVILQDNTTSDLLSVSGSLQTRQYILRVIVEFEITDRNGRIILRPQVLADSRVITVQSNQVLGSSNEENLFYQQMRRNLATSIMNRLASRQVTNIVISGYSPTPISNELLSAFRPVTPQREPDVMTDELRGEKKAPTNLNASPLTNLPPIGKAAP